MYNHVDNVDNFEDSLKIKAFACVDKTCINPAVFHSKKTDLTELPYRDAVRSVKKIFIYLINVLRC